MDPVEESNFVCTFACSPDPIFTRDELKTILKRADEMRLSKEVQDAISEKDDIELAFSVTREIYASIVREYQIPDEESALDEVFSARAMFTGDKDMEDFMSTLLHVKYDFTGDGPIQEGDDMVDAQLFDLNGEPRKLSQFVNTNRPLVVFAGSWT